MAQGVNHEMKHDNNILIIPGPDLDLHRRSIRLRSGYLAPAQVDFAQVAPGRACNSA